LRLTILKHCVIGDWVMSGVLMLGGMAKHDPDLSLLFHALSDPTRRAMLAQRAKGPVTVSELAGPTKVTLGMVFATAQEFEAAKGFGAVELGLQTLGKLARFVGAD
jgi:DNA-binding transcriptional ArsR family regulator